MMLRTRKNGVLSASVAVLAALLALLLLGEGVAVAGIQACRMAVAESRTASAPAKDGACCCCKGSSGAECSTGLQGGCGQTPTQEKSATIRPLFDLGNLGVGLSPSPVQAVVATFYRNDQGPVLGRESAYLINAKLIC